MYIDRVKNNESYTLRVRCGIVEEEEDESIPVNLRDRKKNFNYSDYGNYEDTSLCWSMAKNYPEGNN